MKLNSEQKKAVRFGFGPLLIIAGAGTGKTTVITERIKNLIIKQNIKPQEILALTFTEKAALEMETRVDTAMPYGYTQMWISTFHKFCDRILRNEAVHIGLNPGYKLFTDTDATMLFRKNLFKLNLEYFRPLGNPGKFIAGILQHFSRLQDEDISPNQYIEWVRTQNSVTRTQQNEENVLEQKKYQELANAYKFYADLKIQENVMDFGDLISNALQLFRTRKNILKKYQSQFKFVLVDEFQDTNIAQYELIKLLAPLNPLSASRRSSPNLTVVGDDNQSIYKFRGAAISNILHFQKDYKNCQQIVLRKNYRSYQYILDSSRKLIKHNDPDTLEAKLGISKNLTAVRKTADFHKIEFIHENRVEDEAEVVAKKIKELKSSVILNRVKDLPIDTMLKEDSSSSSQNDRKWSDFAILVRANNHAESFIRALGRASIPYQFLGPAKLYRQPEVKELIAYLQVLNDFTDNSAFFKVLSMPFFDISQRDLIAISNWAKRNQLSIFEGVEIITGVRIDEKLQLPFISDLTREKITKLVKMILNHLKLTNKETAGQILFYFLENSGMLKNILEFKTPIDERQAGNITKFFNKLKSYEAEHEDASVIAVLDWLMLSMELGESPQAQDMDWTDNDAVNILTTHSSKGLEFPVVFLVNLVSQRFPSTERHEQIPIPEELIKEVLPIGDFHLEEERRLFYVGMTRARDLLYLTAANYYGEGKREKKISPFVSEALDKNFSFEKNPKTINQLSLLDWGKSLNPEQSRRTQDKLHIHGERSRTINYLSFSQIEAFKTCPLHYKLRYILKIPTPPSPALSFGSSMHATLKNIYEIVRQKIKINHETLEQLLEKNWIREGYGNKSYENLMKARGKKYLWQYFKKEFDPKTKVLLLEEKFMFPISYSSNSVLPNEKLLKISSRSAKQDSNNKFLKIGGKIDRVDDLGKGIIEIIDYKTGRVPSKREVDKDLQMSIYALAATEIPHLPFAKKPEQIKLSFYYFDTQEKVSTVRTQDQLNTEKENLIKIAQEISDSDYKCSGHKFCENCEYVLWCGI